MKQLTVVVGLCILGFLTWRLGSALSSDALGMAVGVLFGVLAGIPSALLVLASSSRRERDDDDDDDDYRREAAQYLKCPPYYQPPVIVLAAPVEDKPQTVNNYHAPSVTIHTPAAGGMPLLADREREVAAQRGGRVFRVVGEREDWNE